MVSSRWPAKSVRPLGWCRCQYRRRWPWPLPWLRQQLQKETNLNCKVRCLQIWHIIPSTRQNFVFACHLSNTSRRRETQPSMTGSGRDCTYPDIPDKTRCSSPTITPLLRAGKVGRRGTRAVASVAAGGNGAPSVSSWSERFHRQSFGKSPPTSSTA